MSTQKNNSINATEKLMDFISSIRYDQLSKDVINAAKESFLDFLAASIAGHKKSPFSQLLTDYLLHMGGKEESPILAVGRKVPSINAALANGVSGHGMELDDGIREAQGHPGVSVVPASLAAGELINCNGKTLLVAIVAGYEIFGRIGKSVSPSLFYRGFHSTGVCGGIAAACAAGKIMSLNKDKLISTLGIAGTQTCGLLIVTHSGQMMKPLNAGKAAQNGLISALLSRKSAIGSSNLLEGEDGFVQAFSGNCDYSLMLDRLGESFEIENCYRKLYSSCRGTHAAIEAALYLKKHFDIDHKNVKEIEVASFPGSVKLTGSKNMPKDEAGSRFNLAFAVALALFRGKVGIYDFSMENIRSKEINNLFKKIKIKSDPSLESKEKHVRGSKVKVILLNSEKYEKIVQLPKGELNNPLSLKDLKNKYYDCIGNYWSKKKQEKILDLIDNLDNIDHISCLTDSIMN